MLSLVRYREGDQNEQSDPIVATASNMRDAAVIVDKRNSELLARGQRKRYYSDVTKAKLVPITTPRED